ncbi:MAG: hypothetical protein RBT11_01630 [Desulfobacterales bacterium]|jgi:hypothetical protein|nr:hypothetical protein [Desulfobacterales bacterium]
MARKIKVIKIDDLEITIRELRIKDIIELVEAADRKKDAGPMETLKEYLPRLTDLDPEKAIGMAPSELKEVIEAAREVNSDFFDAARAMGAGKILAELRASLERDFSAIVADSLRQATGT